LPETWWNAGLTPMESLRAGTVDAADRLGTADGGELAGQTADHVALAGGPP
jgi:imidazolonepropionase-like amidohydrolase